jgi:uncharacterized protein YjiS (DUF1127 family)
MASVESILKLKRHGNRMAAVRAAVGAVIGWRRRRRSYLALMDLNDHLLKDIGVSRSEIEAASVEGRKIRRTSG